VTQGPNRRWGLFVRHRNQQGLRSFIRRDRDEHRRPGRGGRERGKGGGEWDLLWGLLLVGIGVAEEGSEEVGHCGGMLGFLGFGLKRGKMVRLS
jgi:hypothetical protein